MPRIALATRTSFACVATMLVALAFAGPAQAAFPGANGRVAFQSSQDGDYEVFTVDSASEVAESLETNNQAAATAAWITPQVNGLDPMDP